jgi:hypothetical protein
MKLAAKLILILAAPMLAAAVNAPAGWIPQLFQNESTLQFYTINSTGEEHWSTVWVVVIDGAPYVRLGAESALRIDSNTDAPYVKIRVGGQEFDRVLAQSAPEMTDKVAAAMADKYWSDVLIRHTRHQLTMRLVPDLQTAQH